MDDGGFRQLGYRHAASSSARQLERHFQLVAFSDPRSAHRFRVPEKFRQTGGNDHSCEPAEVKKGDVGLGSARWTHVNGRGGLTGRDLPCNALAGPLDGNFYLTPIAV